jgi:hypothetical protein
MKIIFDEYVWKARILVAFLVALPVFLILPWISRELPFDYPPILTGTIFAGAFYALMASVVREMGVRAERGLVSSWGGYPSTSIMRWRDQTRSKEWKGVQHKMVYDKLKIRLMTPDEEAKDPAEADRRIADAFAQIKNSIWGKASLPTHADNIDYGFARNLYGCRWTWLVLCVLSVATVALGAKFLGKRLPVRELVLETLITVGVIAVEWGFMKTHVHHCAIRYAEHAWETLTSLAERNGPS